MKHWPKLFHNLRASRETRLAGDYPLHVVCEWIGNSALIAPKHFLQVTEENCEQAAQIPAQSAAKRDRQPETAETDEDGNVREIRHVHLMASSVNTYEYAWRDSNPQPSAP